MFASRTQILGLYRTMLRDAKNFKNYNFQSYAQRHIREEFRKSSQLTSAEAEKAIKYAQSQAQILSRQVVLSNLYPAEKSVMESFI